MLKAALIGCGKIGSEFAEDPRIKGIYTHAGAYDACPSTQLVAVCDICSDKANRAAARWQSVAYTDAITMLNECKPEIVSICSTDDSHFGILCDVVMKTNGVRAILVEKPLAMNMQDAREAIRLAHSKGIQIAVNYSRRYSTSHQQLHKRLLAGEIGSIQTVSGYYTKGTRHNGSHWFDLARFLVGEVADVWARNSLGEENPDPTLDVVLSFKNGASGSLQALDANAYSLFEMDIIGKKGRVSIYDSGHRMSFYQVGDSPYYSGYQTLLPWSDGSNDMANTLLYAVQDLVNSLKSGETVRCSGEDGVAALAIAEAAFLAAATGRVVKLDDIK